MCLIHVTRGIHSLLDFREPAHDPSVSRAARHVSLVSRARVQHANGVARRHPAMRPLVQRGCAGRQTTGPLQVSATSRSASSTPPRTLWREQQRDSGGRDLCRHNQRPIRARPTTHRAVAGRTMQPGTGSFSVNCCGARRTSPTESVSRVERPAVLQERGTGVRSCGPGLDSQATPSRLPSSRFGSVGSARKTACASA